MNYFNKKLIVILTLIFLVPFSAVGDAQPRRFIPGEFAYVRNGTQVVTSAEQGCLQMLGEENYNGFDIVQESASAVCYCHTNPGNSCATVFTNCQYVTDIYSWGVCHVASDAIDTENAGSSCGLAEGTGADVGDPINALAGNKHQTEIDFVDGAGVFPLAVVRTYNSINLRLRPWSFSFDHSLQIIKKSNTTSLPFPGVIKHITYKDGAGRTYVFHQLESGIYQSADSQQFSLSEVPTGYLLSKVGNTVLEFDKYGLVQNISSNGVRHQYSYDSIQRMEKVTHQDGDYIRINYINANSPIFDKIFFSNREEAEVLVLEYEGFRNITEVRRFQEGELAVRKYVYENSQRHFDVLKAIVKEDGHTVAAWDYDPVGKATASYLFLEPCVFSDPHVGDNCRQVDRVDIDYSNFLDDSDRRVTVENAFQKKTIYHFDIFSGIRKVTKIEGHQSENCAAANKNYTYYPSGLLETKTDWKNSTTSYQYNTRNLESSRTEALGAPQERTITTEWHPTFNLRTKITEPGRETNFIYDTEGRLLSQINNNLLLN